MKKERSSNIELDRIVTMLLIVAHHYVVNSGLTAAKGVVFAHPLSKRSLFLLLFGAWGKTGINCFVLITGYFMCKSNITAKKFAKLLLEVWFYRLVINSIFWITGMEEFSWRGLLYTFLVVRNIGDGFTSAYLMFFLFIPFINILIEGLDERKHLLLLALLGFMYVVLGTFSIFSVTMNYVSWFMVVYLIAAYIRLYPKKLWENRALWGSLTLLFMGLASASIVLCMRKGQCVPDPGQGGHVVAGDRDLQRDFGPQSDAAKSGHAPVRHRVHGRYCDHAGGPSGGGRYRAGAGF